MEIYLIVFVIAYLCYIIANKRRNNIIRLSFVLLAVLIPSLLAGFRDDTVGNDLLLYAVPCFNVTRDLTNISQLGSFIIASGLEPAYVTYAFVITRFTDDIFWFYFIQMMICLGLVAFTCYRLRDHINAPLLYFIFLLYCFCQAMSMSRQIFSVCIMFFGYYYLLEKKLLKFVLCIVVAQLFHNSAIFALALYPLYHYAKNIKADVGSIKLFWYFVIGLGFVAVFPMVVSFFLGNGLISAKYEKYMNAEFNTHKINLVFIACVYFMSFINKNIKQYNNIIKIFCICIIILILCGVYNDVMTRVSLYIELFMFINILLCAKEAASNKNLYPALLTIGVLIVFIYCAFRTGYADAIPYTSKTLGIK